MGHARRATYGEQTSPHSKQLVMCGKFQAPKSAATKGIAPSVISVISSVKSEAVWTDACWT